MIVGVGLLGAILLPWALVFVANALPDKTAFVAFDDRVATWQIEHGTSVTDALFRISSAFGSWLLAVVVLGCVAWFAKRGKRREIVALLGAIAGAALVNLVLALTFRRAHPTAATDFQSVAQGVSFPSGHSMLALVGYGMLTYFVLRSSRASQGTRIAALFATTALVILIGFARIYLGVHSVSDVVLGYAAGSVWLAACAAGYRQLSASQSLERSASADPLQVPA